MQHCSSDIKELDLRDNHFAINAQQTDRCSCAMWETWLHSVMTKFDPMLKFFRTCRGNVAVNLVNLLLKGITKTQ